MTPAPSPTAAPAASERAGREARIKRTEFNMRLDCWMYLLDTGAIVYGEPGHARVPAGIAFNARNQWGADQAFGRPCSPLPEPPFTPPTS